MTGFDILHLSHQTAFLFPGQGSQTIGMGAEAARHYAAARDAFAEADDVLGFALSRLCFDGPEEVLTDTVNAQPALLATSVAIARAVADELGGAAPSTGAPSTAGATVLVAGHSMGEYSALVAAGSISYADGLRLVRERGRLMKAAGTRTPGMMAAVLGLDEEQVAAVCRAATAESGIAQVANDNCPGQVVISGDKVGMEAALAALRAAGARKVMPLAVSIAAHSPLMAPAAAEFKAVIDATPIQPPVTPLIGNTTATVIRTVAAIRAELAAQLTGSVRWTASMQTALDAGITRFVELGSGDVLTGLMKRIDRSASRLAVNDVATIQTLAQTLAEAR